MKWKKINRLDNALHILKKECGEFLPIGVHLKEKGKVLKLHFAEKNNIKINPKTAMIYVVLGEEDYKSSFSPTLKETHLSTVSGMTVDIDHGELLGEIPDWRNFIFDFVSQVEEKWGFVISLITFSSGVGYDKPKKAHLHIMFPKIPLKGEQYEKIAVFKEGKRATAALFEHGLIEYCNKGELPPINSIESVELRGVVDLSVAERNWWISIPGSYNLKYDSPVKRVGFYKEIDEPTRMRNIEKASEVWRLFKNKIKTNIIKPTTSDKHIPARDPVELPDAVWEDANRISWDSIFKYNHLPDSVLYWVRKRREGKATEWCGGEGHLLRLKVARYLEQKWGSNATRFYFALGHKLFSLMDDYNPELTQSQLMWVYTHPFEGKIIPEKHIDPLLKKFIHE